MKELFELSKEELIDLLIAYNEYIYNDGELWNVDRQPIGIEEFYYNEYMEELNYEKIY